MKKMNRYIDIEPYEKDGWYLQKHYHNSYGEVIETTPLISIPTVDAVPVRHGHWIDVNGDGSLWRCSVCGEIQCCNSNYCGDCGAKMDGQQNG